MLFPFIFPFRLLNCGVSSSGKSCLTAKILETRNESISPTPEHILYYAKYKTSVPTSLLNVVEFHTGLPSQQTLENEDKRRTLIVLDDVQNEAFNSLDYFSISIISSQSCVVNSSQSKPFPESATS